MLGLKGESDTLLEMIYVVNVMDFICSDGEDLLEKEGRAYPEWKWLVSIQN